MSITCIIAISPRLIIVATLTTLTFPAPDSTFSSMAVKLTSSRPTLRQRRPAEAFQKKYATKGGQVPKVDPRFEESVWRLGYEPQMEARHEAAAVNREEKAVSDARHWSLINESLPRMRD